MNSRERTNRYRAERRERGLCLQCGDKNDRHPKWFCTNCLDEHNRRTLAWAKKAKAKGVCTNCGSKRDREGWVCTSCLNRDRKRKGVRRLAKQGIEG